MTNQLTILLPLKGRHLHTLRFLYHANLARLPYHFLIADGEVHPAIARVLENSRENFPNLDIEYVQYPDDATYRDYYCKLADAAARVKTPYVMQADNDDFLVATGIDHCIAFLESYPDYAACGGGVGGFTLHAAVDAPLRDVTGGLRLMTPRAMPQYVARDDNAPSLAQRIEDGFPRLHTSYYSVFRSEALATIHRELLALNFSDLHLHEVYFGGRALTLGKAKLDTSVVAYMRQGGTGTPISSRTDWARHLIYSRFTIDLAALLDRLAELAEPDVAAQEAFKERLRPLFGQKLRAQLEDHYRTPKPVQMPRFHRPKQAVRALLPKAAVQLVQRDRSRLHSAAVWKSEGASDGMLSGFRREWSLAESVIDGQGFVTFARATAPELLAS